MYPIIKADLENRLGASEVQRYTLGDSTRVDRAIGDAWSTFRSEALNVWTAASVDALTAETLPGEAHRHIVSDACDILSTGSSRMGAAEEIAKKAEEARMWRIRVSRDEVRCFDGLLERVSGAEARDGVSYQAPARKLGDPWRYRT
jgi:hypothetical protein